VVSNHSFNLHFLNDIWYKASFHILFVTLYLLFKMFLVGLEFELRTLHLQSSHSALELHLLYVFFDEVSVNVFDPFFTCLFSHC
jgi:hypothetical protein